MNASPSIIHHFKTTEKLVSLTFDDWASEETTLRLLNILDVYDVKTTSFLIAQGVERNPQVARGSIINERALVSALREGKFFGVALDVFETEPLEPDNPLYDFEWVTLTPHNSYVSDRMNDRLFENILKNLQREKLKR